MYKYCIYFENKDKTEFTSDIDINMHELKGKALCFNDLYINLEKVNCIRKEVIREDG